jgi:hypothetical protein
MKKANLLLTALFLILISFSLQAQEKPSDFYLGKWDVLIQGTPSGDIRLLINIEEKDGSMAGTISSEGTEGTKADKIMTNENSATVYWFAAGYDVYLTMNRKEENKVDGNLMGMFTAIIERVK